ncbi:corrinoid protein [Thermodesulfobacteriota bacterium]
MFDFKAIENALVGLDKQKLLERVKDGLSKDIPAVEMLNKGLVAGMDIVGGKMQQGEMFIPEVLKAAKIMAAAVEILKPHLAEKDIAGSGTIVMGTVKGDLHDIGKNLVAMMLESAGFKVFDLGVDVLPERFVAEIRERKADLLGVSALLTTTTSMMKQIISAVTDSGLRDQIKIMVGGAPITQVFADEVGADGYAPDAGSAVRLAKSLV